METTEQREHHNLIQYYLGFRDGLRNFGVVTLQKDDDHQAWIVKWRYTCNDMPYQAEHYIPDRILSSLGDFHYMGKGDGGDLFEDFRKQVSDKRDKPWGGDHEA